jgi:hypothetical protein
MPSYIIKGDEVHFKQSFPRSILMGLFTTLYALGIDIGDTGNKIYPNRVIMSESEFLSVLELAQTN